MLKRFFTLLLILLVFDIPFHTQAQTDADYRVIYANDAGEVIALNPVTGEQTIFLSIENPLTSDIGFHPSPDGSHLAVYARIGDDPRTAQYHLYVIRSADGQILLDQNLLPEGYTYPEAEASGDPNYELTRTLNPVDSVVWSPTGQYIAFISGHNSTADVYIFEPASGTLSRLDDVPHTAAFLKWNPAGSALVFSELVSFGTGGGYQVYGHYAASIPSGELRILTLPEVANTSGMAVVGWLDETHLVYAPYNFVIFGASGLYILDLVTLESTEILPSHLAMTVPVFDPTTQTVAFVVPDVSEGGLVPGAYLWRYGDAQPSLLQAGTFYVVERVRPSQFQFAASEGNYLLTLNSAEPLLTPLPASLYGAFVSPNPSVDAVVLSRADGVYVSSLLADDASLVWGEDTQVPVWSPDGSKFYTFGFVPDGAGLVEVDVLNRSLRLLDSRMAVNSPRAILP
jgi:dipeptidyl aminopeptidase/acylaminoacyl peptidase